MSKTTLLLTVVALGWAAPASLAAPGASELESLRQKCADQEREILRLKEENLKLRGQPASGTTAGSNSDAQEIPAPDIQPETDDDGLLPAVDPTDPAGKNTGKSTAETPAETAPRATPVEEGSGAETTGKTYTVVPRDSLDKIARKNGCTAEALAKANGLKLTSIIHPGLKLKIPATSATTTGKTSSNNTDTPATSGKTTGSSESTTGKSTGGASSKPDTRTDDTQSNKTRAVKIDEEMTYGQFAEKYSTSIERLNDLNGLDLQKDTVLAKGSELYVPGRP